MPSGFIHLPYLPEQTVEKAAGTPSMALETQVVGVRAAIEGVRAAVAASLETARV
jgi:pyroglutamyl-peptidase